MSRPCCISLPGTVVGQVLPHATDFNSAGLCYHRVKGFQMLWANSVAKAAKELYLRVVVKLAARRS